ncbi:MAG: RNA polymerase subunit sigma-70 [Planctomycetes bacterium]|nr:RNA polymerase subunit sigma-70 [Planctomycetota bacterium]MBL7040409.1 RNA polymerase subunit sigma-70 [Pirellulaceae bacterium]
MTAGPEKKSVTEWLEELKQGDQDAARHLWERYFTELVRVARGHLANAPRRVADEEDIALSVFDSLCEGVARGRFPNLNDRDDLWQVLLMITRQKSVDYKRREGRRKRGGGEVRGESAFRRADQTSGQGGLDLVLGEAPTPSFLAEIHEQLQRLLAMLRDDTVRQVALRRMEGYTIDEISQQLDISKRAVDRKLRVIREKWSRELNA